MDEFIAYVEQFDLSGPVWIHEEFHGAHTYWFDESESANVPTVGGVRVDKARMFVDDAGDAMILLGFYDPSTEEHSEHKLGEPSRRKRRSFLLFWKMHLGRIVQTKVATYTCQSPKGCIQLRWEKAGLAQVFMMTMSHGCAIQPFA